MYILFVGKLGLNGPQTAKKGTKPLFELSGGAFLLSSAQKCARNAHKKCVKTKYNQLPTGVAQHYAMWPSMNPNGPQTAKKGTKPFFTHAHTMPKTTSGIVCTCVKNGVVPFLVVCGPFRLILGHVAYCWATLDVFGGFRLCARFCALLAHFLAPKCRPVKDHI